MITAVLALALALHLVACGGVSPVQQAQAAVDGMFAAIKTLNLEELGKYTDAGEFLGDADELDQMPGGGEEFLKSLFSKLQYEILGSEQTNEETVYVTTLITAVDMKPVLGQFMSKAMEYAMAHMFDDPAPTDEQMETEMMNIFVQLLSADELDMVNDQAELKVVKTESGWRVEANDSLVDAMLGGLEEAAEELFGSVS